MAKLLNSLMTFMGLSGDEDDEDSYYDEEEESGRRLGRDRSDRRDRDTRNDREDRYDRYDDYDDRYDRSDRYAERNERSDKSDRYAERNDRTDRSARDTRSDSRRDTRGDSRDDSRTDSRAESRASSGRDREEVALRNTYTPNSARHTSGKSAAPAQETYPGINGMKMIVYHPVTYEDTRHIIDNIKKRKPVIVNMEDLEVETAQRILDFLSGAIYALDGTMTKISRGIFIVAPTNCDVVGNDDEVQYDQYDE